MSGTGSPQDARPPAAQHQDAPLRGEDPRRNVEIAVVAGMHRAGTMNYYYADAGGGCWSGLKALVDHVNEVAASARKSGYPRLKEDEKP